MLYEKIVFAALRGVFINNTDQCVSGKTFSLLKNGQCKISTLKSKGSALIDAGIPL